jgi:predicted dehydrogenase
VAEYVKVIGLQAYLKPLKGKVFKDVNRELRMASKRIALDILPTIVDATGQTGAPQSAAMARTVRVHSDRVPVVVIGKVNPRFASGFRRAGSSAAQSKMRRGALAHGVVYGPKGGKRSTPANENYYRKRRDETGGAVGRAMRSGPAVKTAQESYRREYYAILRRYGFKVKGV